jgi:hypothetical protein
VRWWRCCSGTEAVEENKRGKRKTGGGVLREEVLGFPMGHRLVLKEGKGSWLGGVVVER